MYIVVSSKSLKSWKKKFNWINYDESKQAIFCEVCCEAHSKKLPLPTNRQSMISKQAFVEDGFRTFKNAPGAFAPHENGEFHRAALASILNSKKTTVLEKLSDAKKKEMMMNRIALQKIFTSVLHLAQQGQALRGHEDKDSNLESLLVLRSQEIPELKTWLQRDNFKWMHNTIINEILNLMAEDIRNRILSRIKKSKNFAILLDETSDISKLEQVSICTRIVDDNLEVSEYFMEFCTTKNTKAESLLDIVTDFFKRKGLDIHDLRGQCYDGASNVSGCLTGLQTRVIHIERRALFVHCSAHRVSLCVQDALEDIPLVKNAIGIIQELINFVRDSPKRVAEFKEIQPEKSSNLVSLCRTRLEVTDT